MVDNLNRSRRARSSLALITGLSALLTAGCTSAPSGQPSAPPVMSASAPGSTASPETSGVDALVAAGERAMQGVPDSTLIAIETERGGTVWEVQVVTTDGTEHQLDISADGKTVVSGPRAEDDDAADKAKHLDRISAAKIDFAEAARLILDEVPGGSVQELGLDSEADRIVWEGDVFDASGVKHEVQLDAGNGSVIKNQTDS